MRDLYSNIEPVELIAPAAHDEDVNGAVDRQGSDSLDILIHIGVGGITFTTTNKIEFVLEHSDDGVTYAPVGVADVQGVTPAEGGIVKSLVAAHAAAEVVEIGYLGGKRHVKLTAGFGGTHATGTPISAIAIKGNLENR